MLAELQKKAQQLLAENASTFLTAGGVAGTVGTAVLTGRASFKAAEIIRDKEVAELAEELVDGEPPDHTMGLDTKSKVFLVWPLFLPPIGLGGVTITSIIMAHRISAAKAAALAVAYGLIERDFDEYKEKALEKLGVGKEQKLRDEIAQDRVNANPPDKQVVILAGGDVLCYDMLTGRYFQSTVENIKKAENRLNHALLNHDYASLSEFYEEIGLAPTSYTDEVGWNSARDGTVEVRFSTAMSQDDKPCVAVDFNTAPHPDYIQRY